MSLSSPAWFAVVALLAFVGLGGWPLAAWTHLLLAVGVLPLILAAMLYFTPVLTRSGPVDRRLHLLPWLALLAGGLACVAIAWLGWLLGVALSLALLVTVGMAVWMARRAARTLGAPHPGLRWYQAALLCLLGGLLAMLATLAWPEQWAVLRSVHRHLNLLGFVGLSAIGTLQVLLPTVGGYADPTAGQRLRFDLKYALSGSLLLAVGTAGWPLLIWAGAGAWGWVLGDLLYALRGHAWSMTRRNGAAFSLLSALLGFALALGSALWQAEGVLLPLFFALFLFPLVSGAVAHLLPLWWWPGQLTPWRDRAQEIFGRYAWLRVGAFWGGGVAISMGYSWGLFLAIVPLLFLLGQVVWLYRRGRLLVPCP
ncbi:MAG: hypothetical protein H7835_12190 [Magnetococcus sp. XQGC-1]